MTNFKLAALERKYEQGKEDGRAELWAELRGPVMPGVPYTDRLRFAGNKYDGLTTAAIARILDMPTDGAGIRRLAKELRRQGWRKYQAMSGESVRWVWRNDGEDQPL
jgi:hypothetical protein